MLSPCVVGMSFCWSKLLMLVFDFGCRNDGIIAGSSSSWELSATEGGLEGLRSNNWCQLTTLGELDLSLFRS